MEDLKDKVVLITGAGPGLGRALALAFAARGAGVALNDISPLNVDETVEQITAAGGRARGYTFDLAKRMPVTALVAQVLEDWGRIDFLVNCAAVEPQAAILDMDEWDWHRTLDVNLSGAFFTTQQAGRAMRTQGGGVIVNLACVPDEDRPLPGRAAYLASQAGLAGLSRSAAAELAEHGIRVHLVCPQWSLAELAALPDERAELVWQVLMLCSGAGAA